MFLALRLLIFMYYTTDATKIVVDGFLTDARVLASFYFNIGHCCTSFSCRKFRYITCWQMTVLPV